MANEPYHVYESVIFQDLNNAHAVYQENNLAEPISYSYPYGAANDWSETIMKNFGYTATFFTTPARLNIIETKEDLYGLQRLNRPYAMTTEDFFAQLETMERA